MIKAQNVETCLISSCSLVNQYPSLFCYLSTCPSSCHLMSFLLCSILSQDSDILLNLNRDRSIFSTLWENFDADLTLVIEMQRSKENTFKSLEDHFSRQCPGLQGTFLTALCYLHIRSRMSLSFFHSHCNKWFPFIINSNLPSADGYFRSISAKLMSSHI